MTTVLAGDFAEFYGAHFHEAARQLYAYLDDHAEAQDIAQAFSRAFLRWHKIGGHEHLGVA
jgi:RNA polymerase sigma-70 factor (ECF subfamily)